MNGKRIYQVSSPCFLKGLQVQRGLSSSHSNCIRNSPLVTLCHYYNRYLCELQHLTK